jgi:hypothetical protein
MRDISGENTMPNLCDNEIIITGNSASLKRLKDMVKTEKSDFDFSAVIPYPEKYRRLDADKSGAGYQSGGYEWCIKYWGTKWNNEKNSVGIEVKNCELGIFFLTAWTPSIPVTIALAKLFQELEFIHLYEEGSNNFSGKLVCKNGKVIFNEQGAYGDFRIHEDDFYNEFD